MKKIAIMVPAIVDQECANALVNGVRDKILLPNKDFSFHILLNIDNYCRKGCSGTSKSIEDKYRTLEQSGCAMSVTNHNSPLGLPKATQLLFRKFLETDCDYLMFMDDDCIMLNPVPFGDFIHLIKDNVTIHLAFAFDTVSVENPFIQNNVYYDGEKTRVFGNSRVFCTENGTFFTRNYARDILQECPFDPNYDSEDNIGKTKRYRRNPVYTVAYKNGKDENVIVTNDKVWPLKKENHFIVDSIRYYRKVGWNK